MALHAQILFVAVGAQALVPLGQILGLQGRLVERLLRLGLDVVGHRHLRFPQVRARGVGRPSPYCMF